jgi:hypothetical protein
MFKKDQQGYVGEFWIPDFNEEVHNFFDIMKEWRDDPENAHSLMFNAEVKYYLSEDYRSDPTNSEYSEVWDKEKARLESLFDIKITNFMISVTPKE